MKSLILFIVLVALPLLIETMLIYHQRCVSDKFTSVYLLLPRLDKIHTEKGILDYKPLLNCTQTGLEYGA